MYCMNCGNKLNENAKFCDKCGNSIENIYQNKYEIEEENNSNKLTCPHCGSNNINVQIVSENKGANCFTILLYIFLAMTIVGIPIMILILLLKGGKTINKKYYVCQNCGKSFYPNSYKSTMSYQLTNFSAIRVIIGVFIGLILLILMFRLSTI